MAEKATRAVKGSTDWVTPVAMVGGGALLLWGAKDYLFPPGPEEGKPRSLKIDRYRNLDTGIEVVAPGVLEVDDGERVQVFFSYTYKGLAIDGKYHVAFAQNHDELSPEEKPFSLPETEDDTLYEDSMVLTNEGMKAKLYGIYVKIMSIPGGDIHYWKQNIIKVPEEPQVGDFEFVSCIASPDKILPGQQVSIFVEIINNTGQDFHNFGVQLRAYEGLVVDWTSQMFNVPYWPSGGEMTLTARTTALTDVGVYRIGVSLHDETGAWFDGKDFSDVLEVLSGNLIQIGNLTVTPYEGPEGTTFKLEFPVTNNGSATFNGTIEVLIREGAATGTGKVLDTRQMPLYIPAGQTGNVSLNHVGEASEPGDNPQEDRDVDVNIYDSSGNLVSEADFHDDAFRVLHIPEGFSNVKVESVAPPATEGGVYIIICSWTYKGPATSEELYVAIGHQKWPGYFDEVIHGTSNHSIPECVEPASIWGSVIFTAQALDALDPNDSPYDVYCKIAGEISPAVEDILEVN